MTYWQSNRFGRTDHSRPNANTVVAECENLRISRKKHFRERKQKPVSLIRVGKAVPASKIINPGFSKGAKTTDLKATLRLYYIAHFEGKFAELCRCSQELARCGLISEHPLFPEDRSKYQITKLGVDYFNQICTRDKSGDDVVPSNMGERRISQ